MSRRLGLTVAVLLGASAMPTPVSANHCPYAIFQRTPPDNIRIELTVPITTVAVGQPVPMILEVENTGSEPVEYSLGQQWDYYRFVVRDGSGHALWVEVHPLTRTVTVPESQRDRLSPGERRIEPQVWAQTTCMGAGLPLGPSVSPGRYTAQAIWLGPFWASNIVDIVITG